MALVVAFSDKQAERVEMISWELLRGPMTCSELSEALGLSYALVYAVLEMMQRGNWVEKGEGRPHRWCLTDEAKEELTV